MVHAFICGLIMIKGKIVSSLCKVFENELFDDFEINNVSMLKNERFSFQVVLTSDEDSNFSFSIDSDITEFISMFKVVSVPVSLAAFERSDDFFLKKDPGLYPDILKPLSDLELKIKKDTYCGIWIEINPESKISGKHILKFTANNFSCSLTLNILDAALPENDLIYTNWYHSDCLADYYKIDVFSDEYWRINRNFIKCAAEHGINCILTPLFTPALDTAVGWQRTTVQLVGVKIHGAGYIFDFSNLKKWIEMCRDCGIKYFEMSHFFTQWGARHAPKIMATDKKGRTKQIFGWNTRTSSRKYDNFIRALGIKLNQFLKEYNLVNNVFFHISDEPTTDNLKTYRKRAGIIKEVFADYPVIDAMSDYEFYKYGTVDIPIPSESKIEKFYGKVDTLWTYYCCGQTTEYVPNRFLAMPSVRNRVIGLMFYKYDIKGFLQWGYNFYNSHLSLTKINPFEVTDAGGKFPSGDSFVVYPSDDGKPYCSLRIKVLYEAIQDRLALKLLESFKGREYIESLIGNLTFKEYPHSAEWLFNLREQVNEEISRCS